MRTVCTTVGLRERERARENRGEDCLHNCGGEREKEVRTVCIAVGMREREEEDCLHHSGYERGEEGIVRNTGETICFTVGMRVRGVGGRNRGEDCLHPSGCEREEEGRNGGRDCLHQFGMYSLERMQCAFQHTIWKLHYLHFSIQLGKNVVFVLKR